MSPFLSFRVLQSTFLKSLSHLGTDHDSLQLSLMFESENTQKWKYTFLNRLYANSHLLDIIYMNFYQLNTKCKNTEIIDGKIFSRRS